jgi:signal transduction histidine kinase/putative methionine-R-sulfoxide reductase with GAF domain
MSRGNPEAQERRRLIGSSSVLAFEIDAEGGVLWASDFLADILEKNAESFEDSEMEDLVSLLLAPEYQIQAENSIYRVMQEVDASAKFKGGLKSRLRDIYEFNVSPTSGRGVFVIGTKLEGEAEYSANFEEVREAQAQLKEEKDRLEVLYKVSQALQSNLDPSLVALQGLKSLLFATKSDSGMVFFYDDKSDRFEIAAIHGIPEIFLSKIEKLINGQSIARKAIGTRLPAKVDNIQDDERAVIKEAKIDGLKSAIVCPLFVGDRHLGSLAIFRKEIQAYHDSDMSLVAAAASQIAAATFQAELYAAEKKQAGYFAALYRMSHELSGHMNPKDLAQRAFHIINRELACKRMWLGTLNEQGTHLIGQAGFGPGVRKNIINTKIEIRRDRSDLLGGCLNRREPLIVSNQDWNGCPHLRSLVEKLNLESCAIIPIVSMAQTVGLLVVEPVVSAGFFNQQKLSFLGSMANEIAVVLLATKFQNKVAETDKMRMAGLFASAVAHNFNNMLQVILGQASLIEMQEDLSKSANEAASLIRSAALRGANLVKQLLSYAASESAKAEILSTRELIDGARELYRAILGSNIQLRISYSGEFLNVKAERGQLQQVISNILLNAKEAMAENMGEVSIGVSATSISPGEVDPDLVPGRYVRIDIRDNGVGMSEDVRARCFEPFFTTKNIDPSTGIGVSGSGLGLSTVYSIIKKSAGTIVVESLEGQGSTFSIYLPEFSAQGESDIESVIEGKNTQEIEEKYASSYKSLERRPSKQELN